MSQTIDLARIRPEKNERRFYSIQIGRSLFDEIVLIRIWGRIGRPGRLRTEFFPDLEAAHIGLAGLADRKRRRGYTDRMHGLSAQPKIRAAGAAGEHSRASGGHVADPTKGRKSRDRSGAAVLTRT